jgi:ABC-type transport system substrate-binding protein
LEEAKRTALTLTLRLRSSSLPAMKNTGDALQLRMKWVCFVFGVLALSCTSAKNQDPPGTLNLSVAAKIKGLDPGQASDLYSSTMVSLVYEGLLDYHYLKRPYTLQPALAESMPSWSTDRKTLTFKIKSGVVFQDDPSFKETAGKGRELTAEDFVYTFKRLADPKAEGTGFWIFDGKIVGLNAWREEAQKTGKADYARPVEGLRALDRYTLQLKLIEPSYQMLYYLAMPFATVVPREAVEQYGADFVRNPVGTGPYRLDRNHLNLNSKLVFTRNPTYRKVEYPSEGTEEDQSSGLLEDAGKLLPIADRINVQVLVEPQTLWLNFLDGKIDVSTIPKDNFQQAVSPTKDLSPDLKAKGIRLLKQANLDVTRDSFNLKDPILGKNKTLRQALSLALNVEPVIELFYNGRALPAQGPVPPGLAGNDPGFKNPYREFNIAKAKDLLAKAGYPEGKGLPPIEYLAPASSTSRQVSDYIAQSFAQIGVQLKPNLMTWPEFEKSVKNKKGQMYGFAWGADYPDAENFLQLFYSKNVSPGPNDSNYTNPEFDRLFEAALKLPDSPPRTELYKKMVRLLAEDAPWIFGVHRVDFVLAHPWVRNVKLHEFDNGRWKYYRVVPELKKK